MKTRQKDFTRPGRYSRLLPTALLLVLPLLLVLAPLSGALADTNLALGKPATQSSDHAQSSCGEGYATADLAVDGNTDGNRPLSCSVTHTEYEYQAWWQVDLQGEYPISGVDIWNRTDGFTDRLSNFDVLISRDGETWTNFYYPGTAPVTTHFDIDAVTRYVKVQLRGTNYLSLAEVQVWGTNTAPVANDDSYTIEMDTMLSINRPGVLENDIDPSDTYLHAVKETDPANGVANIGYLGKTEYTPDTGFIGTDSFTYYAQNDYGQSNIATVTITVTPPNTAPVANDDSYTLSSGGLLTIPAPGVLGNDTDGENNPLTAAKVSSTANGYVTLFPDGSFQYNTIRGFTGPDIFTYIANDGQADSNEATVTIMVHPPNTAPVANDDSYTTNYDTPLTISASGVLENDTDAENNTLTAVIDSDPASGTLTLNADGSFTYTPNAGYSGTDSFTYTANDGQADSNTATVTITVNPNQAPVAVEDSYYTDIDTELDIPTPGVLENDTDPDGGTLAVAHITSPAHGVRTLYASGHLIYTPETGFNGVDSFTYTATDGTDESDYVTVTIAVGPNTAPAAAEDSYTAIINTPLTVSAPGVLDNDTDGENNPLTAAKASDPANGTVEFNDDGSFTYTPNTDFTGDDSFTYTANDGQADSNTAIVSITVNPNQAPVANDDSYTTAYNTTLDVPVPGVLSNDTDPDGSELAVASLSSPAHGDLTLYSNGHMIYTPDTGYSGPDTFTYTATDGMANSNTVTVTITVGSPPNTVPVAENDSYTTNAGKVLTISDPGVLGNDTDADSDTLTAVKTGDPANGTVALNPNGSFTYTPNAGFSGSDSFTYTANDGQDNSNTATVTITVNPNQAPVAENDSYTTDYYTPLTISIPGVLGNDTDAESDPLTAVKTGDPANGTVALNADGSFTYTPNAGFSGSDSFTYTANDGKDDSNTATVTITVNSNQAPVAANDSYTTDYYTPLTVAAPGVLGNDTDDESDTLTAVKTGGPANGTVALNADGSFTYTPKLGYSGTDSFTYTANDGQSDSNAATVEIQVDSPAGDASLLGHWKFDEGTGTAAADSSIYNNTGTLSGGAAFDTDAAPINDNPGALNVAGTSGVVTVPNSAINQLTSNFTLMGWIKTDTASGYQYLIASDKTNSNLNGWSFGLLGKKFLMYINGGTKYIYLKKDVIEAGEWNHIAAAIGSDNTVSFYVNGISVGELPIPEPIEPDTDDNLQIGCDAGSRFFDGMIDDVRVYNRALSASEIADAVGVSPCSETVLHTRVMLGEDSGTIELDGACTYTLTSASNSSYGGSGLYIADATTIEGNGATIERDPAAPQFRIMRTSSSIAPTIRNLTLRNGNVASFGGGLRVGGDVTLENVRFENNSTAAGYTGGAMYVTGNPTVDRSAFLGNQSGWGGAIYFIGATGSITNSVFADNLCRYAGAAINSRGTTGSLTLLNNTFTNQYRNDHEAIIVNGPTTAQNNIFHNFSTGLTVSGESAELDEDYNLFASVGVNQKVINDAIVTSGGHSRIAASPRFVEPAADNYRLKQNSPAIDLGVDAGLTIDAGQNQRPYGPTADIGAYEYQGAGIPSVSITKVGPPFAARSGQTQFVLTVINEGTVSLDDLRIVDQLPAGAAYVPGSASDGGTLNGGVMTWDLPSLAPNKIQRVWYSVTASQNLVSANYSVSSISEPTITDSGPAFTTPYRASATALGFTPFPDGYSFHNYGGPTLDSDITEADMLKIYGPGVCNGGIGSPCVLTAAAEVERQARASKSSGGHCHGMAMSSLWIYDHDDVFPDTYEAGAVNTYDITKPNARNLISLFHCTQSKSPVDQAGLEPNNAIQGAANVVNKLIENFSNPNADNRYALGFYKLDYSAGHCVTPYAVDKIDADHAWIYVYDNNHPNNYERVFKVTLSTNEWVYEGAAINPDAPTSAYYGDSTKLGTIRLKSLRWEERFPKECFGGCVDAAEGTVGDAPVSSAYEFDLDGEGSLMITRDDGKRAGTDPATGQFIAEIPGAEEILNPDGLLNTPNDIRIPHEAGHTYGMSISDRPTAYGNRTAIADLNIFGQGFVTRLVGLRIDSPEDDDPDAPTPPGQTDVLGVTLDGDNHSLTFQASERDSDTPDLTMAVSRNGAPDYSFTVIGAELASGRSLSVGIDVETGELTIENDDPAPNGYSLEVERLNTDGSKVSYTFNAISDEGGEDGETIDLGDNWTGGEPTLSHGDPPAPVDGDLNGDGVLDAADYAVFRSTLGKCTGDTGFIEAADFDDDGCITYADYRIWYGYYRNS